MTDDLERERIRGWLVSVVRFPVTRIVLALAAFVAASFLWARVLSALHHLILGRAPETQWLYQITLVVIYHFIYVGFVRLVERRPARELSWSGAVGELGRGILVGAAFLAAVVGLVAALGFYQVETVQPWTAVLAPLAIAVMSGYTEEIMFRGVLLRIVEESLGTWLALLISSLLFGVVHASNPGATVVSTMAIVLEAGVLLGAVYVLTRRLWMAIGTHFAWNFTQAGIFGVKVSGRDAGGLLESQLSGPDLISGGSFGVEASIFAIVIGLALGAVFLVLAHRRGHFMKPFWSNAKSS
jgi:membrane protease YdiL (CAAX protease family)